ncbi:MAG: hypothetical protein AAF391_01180 [Bacteroidota bacterium]
MKKSALLLFSLGFAISVIGQNTVKISLINWSESAAYYNTETPEIKTLGPASDSLSSIYNGREFLYANGKYFLVKSASDYYLWYTQRFPEQFANSTVEYARLYENKDDFGMMMLLLDTYTEDNLPLSFRIKKREISNYYASKSNGGGISHSGYNVSNAGQLTPDLLRSSSRFIRMNRPPVVPSSK